MPVSAKIILDSISPRGDRLTTMEVMIFRFTLPEFNTHRAFSRNSASSRAIPVAKQIKKVLEDPAIPVSWPAEQKGMQGGEELDVNVSWSATNNWIKARDAAIFYVQELTKLGVHKSVTNRLLEPWMWQTIIVSATDWDGFWKQRCSPLAQPELRVAAEAMKAAYDASTPIELDYGQWHTPYITPDDIFEGTFAGSQERLKVSAARCARVSVLNHDGKRDIAVDLALYDRLATADPPHASPLEHVATPCDDLTWGNFDGWFQLRHMVLGV
jgi:hypothetical protein